MPSQVCHWCGAPVVIDEPLARDAECGACGHDLRCCRNCRHFDPNFHNQCRETEADVVEDRERRNFCEYFSYRRAPFAGAGAPVKRQSEARSKLDALFQRGAPGAAPAVRGKREGPVPPTPTAPDARAAEARRKLEDLFGKKPKDDPGAGEG